MPTTRMTVVFKSFVGTSTSIVTQYTITMTSFSTSRSRCCRSPKDPLLVTYDTEERMNLRNQRSYFQCPSSHRSTTTKRIHNASERKKKKEESSQARSEEKKKEAMRGTAARALQNLLRRLPSPSPSPSPSPTPTPTHSYTRLVGLSSRALSSAATAHITIDTTTRLDIDKEPNPRNPVPQNDSIFHQKPTLLSFRHLGLGHRLTEAAKELGVLFPAEIHCAGIPPILKGKSLLLSSHHHSVGSFSLGVLTYLFPLIQCLRRDAKSSTKKPEGPQAIVLCATKELAEELLHVVKSILKSVTSKSKPTTENGQLESNLQEDALDVSRGLLVSTPGDVLQKTEEGSVVPSEIKYLVFDEVDDMFNHGLGSDIQKFLSPLKEHVSNSNEHGMQTILVTSMIKKTLHEDLSSLVEHLESNHAEVAGITVEVDQTEAFHLLESPEALKQKAVEVIQSLLPTS